MLDRLKGKLSLFSFQTEPNSITVWQYMILGILIFFSCYYGISAYAILDMNEGLYAEVAREMLVNKHFIIPYLNNVPYLEKPPLLYWLITLSYHIFGINEFAARVVPSTFMALTCLCVFFAGTKLQASRTGFIAAVILLTSFVFVLMGRIVFFDMVLTFFISASLFSFYFWTQSAAPNRSYLLSLSYAFLGFAILTKGFLALILAPIIMIGFLFLMKAPRSDYAALLNKKALIIFLVIVLPWHILAMFSFAQFTWEYFVNNQFLRFFDMRMPHDYHTGPLYYYIPRAIVYLLPWSIFLPFILWPIKLKRPFEPLKTFLWLWFIVMFSFFSLSGDKGDYYLVIGIIPLAWLLAQQIEIWFIEEKMRWLQLGFYLVTGALSVAGIISLTLYRTSRADFISQLSGNKIPFVLTLPVIILLGVVIVYGAAGFLLSRRQTGKPMISFLLLTGLIVPVLFFYLSVKERTQFMYSQIALAKYVKAQYEHRPVYLYQDFEAFSSFVFYNQEASILVDSQSSDLYFGAQTKDGKNKFISLEDFLDRSKSTNLYMIMRANKLPGFEKIAGKDNFCTVQRNGNVLLLSNAQEDCHALIQVGETKEINLEEIQKNKDEKAAREKK
jgi:4-amino-4-deoxy-L-arabinose transferase-like glycosyltransferase